MHTTDKLGFYATPSSEMPPSLCTRVAGVRMDFEVVNVV